jgi:hypothetical protein
VSLKYIFLGLLVPLVFLKMKREGRQDRRKPAIPKTNLINLG